MDWTPQEGISATNDKVVLLSVAPKLLTLSFLFNKMLGIISFTVGKTRGIVKWENICDIKNMKDILFSLFEKNIFYF